MALDLLFSSRKISGTEAAALGVVNAALPREDVLAHAQQYVRDLAATSSPASMAIMKRQIYQQLHAGLLAAEREARGLMIESFSRPDFPEGVSSFVERRPPAFPRIGRQPAESQPGAADWLTGRDATGTARRSSQRCVSSPHTVTRTAFPGIVRQLAGRSQLSNRMHLARDRGCPRSTAQP